MRAGLRPLNPVGTILVTGSAGFIGFHLCRRLLSEGFEVFGVDNMNTYYDVSLKETRNAILMECSRYRFARTDISDKGAIDELFEQEGPTIVVNLAAQAGVRYSIDNPEAYMCSNVMGFFNVLEACRNFGVDHLVYASSSSVYGGNEKVPFSEKDRVDEPVSLYAATKKSNELMAYAYSKLYGIPATGLRFFTVYGPYGRPDMAYFKFAEKMRRGEPIQVYNDGNLERDFTYVDDVVEAMLPIMGNPPELDIKGTRHKVYNVGNHSPVRLMDFIAELEIAIGTKSEKEFLPMQPGDVLRTCADTTELERDFGYKPETSLSVGLSRFAHWYGDWRRVSVNQVQVLMETEV